MITVSRVSRIEAKNKDYKKFNSAQMFSNDTASIHSYASLHSTLSDISLKEVIKTSLGRTSASNSISSTSSGYNSDTTRQAASQSIRVDSPDIGNTAVPTSAREGYRSLAGKDSTNNSALNYNNSLIRAISADSEIESILSRSVSPDSNNEYKDLYLTAASSIESGLKIGNSLEEVTQEERDTNLSSLGVALSSNLENIDSAYRSQEDLAQEQNDPISEQVQAKLRDMQELPRRMYNYKVTQSQRVQKELRPLVYHEATLSVIEGLGGELLCNHASDDKINQLVRKLKVNTEAAKSLMNTEQEKQKADYLLSKLEAKLKGFVLPSLPDASVAWKIFKEVLLEVQGKNIPKEQYVSAVIDRAQESWEKKEKGNLSAYQIAEFTEIMRQADQTEKMAKFSSGLNYKQRTILASAADKTMEAFITELPFNKAGTLSPEIKNTAKMFILNANIKEELLLKKVKPYLDSIVIQPGLLYGVFENFTTQRDKEIKEIKVASQKFHADHDSAQFINTINLIFKKENDNITSTIASGLAQEAIKGVSNTQEKEILNRHKEVINQLTPILTNLGFSSLQDNRVEIVKYLQKWFAKNKSILSLNDGFFAQVKNWSFFSSSRVSEDQGIFQKLSRQLPELFGATPESETLTDKIMDNPKEKNLSILPNLKNKMSDKLSSSISQLPPGYRKANEEKYQPKFSNSARQKIWSNIR